MQGGPQAARAAQQPENVLAQARKLHQLDPPVRPSIALTQRGEEAGISSGSAASVVGSSWDDQEVARQLAMLTEERNFLRKYVARCESELKAYQLQYPDLAGKAGRVGGGGDPAEMINELAGASVEELPPWIGQAKYMSPLLVAYEARIEELMEKNQEQLHDFAALKHQYDDLFARNSAAEAELEQNIKTLLQHMDQQKGGSQGQGPLDEDEVAQLQEQVKLHREQHDILTSQQLELQAELTRAQQAVETVRGERDAFWSNEVKKREAAIAQMRQDRDRYKNSSSTLTQAQQDLSSLQKEQAALQKKFLATQVQLEQTESELDRTVEREKIASTSLLHAERDIESLLKTMQQMEKEAQEAKAKEVAQVRKEGELTSRAEASRLEKDQALLRESSLRSDLTRLTEKLEFELSAAHRKHDEDLAEQWTRAKEVEGQLQTEISNIGLLLTESDVAKDRALREAAQAKSSSAAVLAALAGEMATMKTELGAAHTRIAELQHSQESSLSKLQRAEGDLQRSIEFSQKERTTLQESINGLKQKNESLTNQNQNLTVAGQRLSENMLRLEKDFTDLRRTSDSTITRLQSQLVELEAQRKAQVEELQMRLDEAYRMQERSESRAVELAAAQDVLAEKWREENRAVRTQLTKMLTEEKNLTADLHARVAEFEARVQQLVRERDQAMTFQSQYENLKSSHEHSMNELQHRLQVLTTELNAYAAREPEYALAQKQTQGRLDRAEIEVKRLTRQYEAAKRKAEFLESQSAGVSHAGGVVHPLQPSQVVMNQAVRSSPTRGESHLQPIPVAQSLLPPTFSKKL